MFQKVSGIILWTLNTLAYGDSSNILLNIIVISSETVDFRVNNVLGVILSYPGFLFTAKLLNRNFSFLENDILDEHVFLWVENQIVFKLFMSSSTNWVNFVLIFITASKKQVLKISTFSDSNPKTSHLFRFVCVRISVSPSDLLWTCLYMWIIVVH